MKNYVSRENFKSKLSKKLRLLKQHHGRQQLTGLNCREVQGALYRHKDGKEGGKMCNNYIFHVHTHRCNHASDECDEKYIERGLQLGASEIVYTDHAPFPGNPFNNRMRYE